MSKQELLALQSNDLTKIETVIAIIEGFQKLPSQQKKALNSIFKQYLNNLGEKHVNI